MMRKSNDSPTAVGAVRIAIAAGAALLGSFVLAAWLTDPSLHAWGNAVLQAVGFLGGVGIASRIAPGHALIAGGIGIGVPWGIVCIWTLTFGPRSLSAMVLLGYVFVSLAFALILDRRATSQALG